MIQASFRIVAPEEKREEILEVLLCLKGPTEVARGCRACRILQDVEDDHVFVYQMQWEQQSDLEQHLRSERFRRFLPYIELSIEPPEISFTVIGPVYGIELLVAALSPTRTEG